MTVKLLFLHHLAVVLKELHPIEMAGGYNALGHSEDAKREAHLAIELINDVPDPLPYYHLGVAELNSGRYDAARSALLQSLEASTQAKTLAYAGQTCIRLGLTALAQGQTEQTLAWADYAEDLLAAAAPHLVVEAEQLRRDVGTSARRGNRLAEPPEGSHLVAALLHPDLGVRRTYNLCVLDVDLFAFLQGCSQDSGTFQVEVPLDSEGLEPRKLMDVLLSDILAIEHHTLYPELVSRSFLARALRIRERDLPDSKLIKASKIAMKIPNRTTGSERELVWMAQNPWPLGFFALLQTMAAYYLSGFQFGLTSFGTRKTRFSDLNVLPYDWRNLPRRIYARYAGLSEYTKLF